LQPDPELVSAALGAQPRSFEPLSQGGYTRSASWRVETADGPAFVKHAEDEGSLHMLRREALVYEHVRGPFLPSYIGFADAGDRAALAIELLENVLWPPPYPTDVDCLFEALGEVAAAPAPPGIPRAGPWRSRWSEVAADPTAFLGLRVCDRPWLDRALPLLMAAEADVAWTGDTLSHYDVYSGNVCFRRRRALLVDWGASVVASHWVDVAFAVLSVRVEDGVLPALDFPDEAAYAASLAGHFALEAPKPPPDWTPPDSTLREDMIGDLAQALRWAAEKLELPLP
jgi:Phosphotransferase enzyme family